MYSFQSGLDSRRNDLAKEYLVGPVCNDRTNCSYRYIIHDKHYNCKYRKCQPSVCNDTVDLVRGCKLLFSCLCQAFADDRRNIDISLICDDTLCVIVKFLFHFSDLSRYIHFGFHLLCNLIISFQKLDGEKSLLRFLYNTCKLYFHIADHIFRFLAELMNRCYFFVALCNGYSFVGSLCDSGSLQGGNLNYFTAQCFFQLINMYGIAVLFYNVHHVNGHDHRNSKLQNLCGQIQVSLNIGTINNVDDGIRFFLKNIISGNYFLQSIW